MHRGFRTEWWTLAVASVSTMLFVVVGAPADAAEADAAKPLPVITQSALISRAIKANAPIYIRIFKEESELEVWTARPDGRFVHIRTFPICKWSGALGPKQSIGDHMAPEGFYSVDRDGLKPDSKYHLALNIGYPNALDRALGRTGDFIMVHGKCDSVGCFAMTDDLIEEIYAFARDALDGGLETVPVHIFPFRMTAAALAQHATHPARATWVPLKQAFDDFERTREPPNIGVCGKRYIVNPLTPLGGDATAACPSEIGRLLAPLSPKKSRKLAYASVPLIADGPKTRTPEDIAAWDASIAEAAVSAMSARRTGTTAKDALLGSMTPLLSTR